MLNQDTVFERDLYWCLNSPRLLNQNTNWPYHLVSKEWLKQISDTIDLNQSTASNNVDSPKRLGRYVESIFATAFSNNPHTELISQSEIVYRAKQSIGELDYIVFDKHSQQVRHLELSCKFYLGEKKESGYQWTGTNARDRFEDKLERFFNHQLSLIKRPETAVNLEKLKVDRDNIESQALFIGWLFYPFKEYISKQIEIEAYLNPEHLRSWWLRWNELDEVFNSYSEYQWCILEKKQWLREQLVSEIPQLYEEKEFKKICEEKMNENKRSFLIAGFQNGEEKTRGFVVDTGWKRSQVN